MTLAAWLSPFIIIPPPPSSVSHYSWISQPITSLSLSLTEQGFEDCILTFLIWCRRGLSQDLLHLVHSRGLLRQRRESRGGCGGEKGRITGSELNAVDLKTEREGEVTCGREEEEVDEGFLRNCIHHSTHLQGRWKRGGLRVSSKWITVKGKLGNTKYSYPLLTNTLILSCVCVHVCNSYCICLLPPGVCVLGLCP